MVMFTFVFLAGLNMASLYLEFPLKSYKAASPL